ncbi:uncharacterized protein B0H18DRAFT_1000349 [Fomitopsis serialis]|uniref:uncharacterized protein n=1 Tax=Fomitopsis serialis TaxID=139415 RepID=UPI002007D6D4|nr:uncharacterized protein B0H18DRAFT_1052241 [Neoantrodia serialis]XP_047894950.1 uncharacterized protein B0H18DRAFT_1000349 [Neoantrodia serialis]KAH9912733.1 hypothetical protein B0H18DRAFT_1052241 [Neoantrodia serialis]KAH9928723.1 hypothetical protein B0H18DRAFT_1000349 [Neoantrodia serialis]
MAEQLRMRRWHKGETFSQYYTDRRRLQNAVLGESATSQTLISDLLLGIPQSMHALIKAGTGYNANPAISLADFKRSAHTNNAISSGPWRPRNQPSRGGNYSQNNTNNGNTNQPRWQNRDRDWSNNNTSTSQSKVRDQLLVPGSSKIQRIRIKTSGSGTRQ